MLIHTRLKCQIGLKLGGINIEIGGKGGILRKYSLFWGENGSFANLFCPPVSEAPYPGMVTLECLICSILLQVKDLEERIFSQKFWRISMWWRHSMTSYLFSGLGLNMWYLVTLATIPELFLNNAEMSMEALFYPLEILYRWCAFSQRYILSIQISWRHLMTSQSASLA